jgi:hypothetical protein
MTPDEQAQLFTNIRKADRVAYGLSMGALEGQQGLWSRWQTRGSQ